MAASGPPEAVLRGRPRGGITRAKKVLRPVGTTGSRSGHAPCRRRGTGGQARWQEDPEGGKTTAWSSGRRTRISGPTASGKLSIRGSKTYKLKGVRSRFLARGQKATLKLKVSKKLLKRIKRALRRHRKVSARLTIKARDTADNTTLKKRTIKLKR